jgi:outer membrane protein
MVNKKGLFSLVAAVLAATCTVSAQKTWTLQECIDYALEHNIRVKQSALTTEMSRYQVDQNKAVLLPSLNGSINRNYSYGRSIDPYTNLYTDNNVVSNSIGLSSGVVLFDGFQLMNTLKQSKLNYLSSQYDERKIRDDISLNVVTAYLMVLYARESRQNAQDQADATRVQRDKTEKMFDAGAVSKANLLDMEAQLGQDEVSVANAEADYSQALLTLAQLLELGDSSAIEIIDPGLPAPTAYPMPADVTTVYALALQNQPDIKASEYRVESAEKGLSIARGGRSPRLSVGGSLNTSTSTSNRKLVDTQFGPNPLIGYTTGGDSVFSDRPSIASYTFGDIPLNDQLNNNLYKTFGFSLSVPIFNGWATRTNIKRAQVSLQQARLNHEQTKNDLYKSVQQAYTDAISSFRKYQAGDKSLKAADEAFRFNDQRYALGLISTYDYLLSKTNLAKAQSALLQSKYDYIFRIKVLDFYQGKPLTF